MAKSAYVNVRVEEGVKIKAEEILNELGINTSTAIDIFLKQIILKDGLPFDVRLPKIHLEMFEDKLAKELSIQKPYQRWFKNIVAVYAKGDIGIDTARFACEQYLNKH